MAPLPTPSSKIIKGPVGCHGKDLFDKQLRFRTRNERISRHGKGIIEKPFLAEDIGHGFPLARRMT